MASYNLHFVQVVEVAESCNEDIPLLPSTDS